METSATSSPISWIWPDSRSFRILRRMETSATVPRLIDTKLTVYLSESCDGWRPLLLSGKVNERRTELELSESCDGWRPLLPSNSKMIESTCKLSESCDGWRPLLLASARLDYQAEESFQNPATDGDLCYVTASSWLRPKRRTFRILRRMETSATKVEN